MSQEKPNLLAKLTAAGRHYRCVREERDAALKACAATLTRLEARVESDTATQAEINTMEDEYERQNDGLGELNNKLETAIYSMASALTELKNTSPA